MRIPFAIYALSLITFSALADSRTGPRVELVRSHYLTHKGGVDKANSIRIAEYTEIRWTKFMGLPVAMHRAVHRPLACVEKRIRAKCAGAKRPGREAPYKPKVLSGWRSRNTYLGAEISNHVFGLAIDLDPTLNSCCGCTKKWRESPLCDFLEHTHLTVADGPGRYEIPDCWIEAFEANGFYWLGHDPQLRDTMHFEYLAPKGAVSCP